ncbi:MAG: efflux RND transporter periplasmic adaptor subunit [Polyangiales bacterium]
MSKDPFNQLDQSKRRRWPLLVVALAALGGGAYYWKTRSSAPVGPRYLTEAATIGDVREVVETTGTVQPTLLVQVGSQVSGRVSRVLVDFNVSVHAGDLLAEIDPTSFRAALAQARAAVMSSAATLQRARVNERLSSQNLARARSLRERNLNAQADLDAAVAQHDLTLAEIAVARAEGARAQAALQTAQANLGFTRIVAPIDGVVIQRAVDEGQTVAASLQAPVLFQIANDLTQMRIVANVDEADVARLRQGMAASARVDAFPRETFTGRVAEVRYGATTTAGVVTYPAVIDVANPDLKLRPGMTATINVVSAEHLGVLRVPNSALRYRPASRGGGDGGVRGGDEGGPRRGDGGVRRAQQDGGVRRAQQEGAAQGRVFVLENNTPRRVRVEVGLADERYTEVRGEGLSAGTLVITEESEPSTSAPAPRGGAGIMGGRSRRGPR